MIKVVAVHTAMALVQPLTEIFKEYLPEVKLNHIADDTLIQEVIANNEVTPAVRRRLLSHFVAAADAGADVVFNTCSSVGDVADYGNIYAPIPVFRIDQPMAQQAVTSADRIGVISTLSTTLDPTRRLLENEARETHDRLIAEAAARIADQVDMFVLAQGSMARMEQRLAELTGKPVLSSPILGVKGLRQFLNL